MLPGDLQQATSMHVSAKTVKYRLHQGGMKSRIDHPFTVQWHPSVRPSTGTKDPGFLKVGYPRPSWLEYAYYVSISWMTKALMWLSG